jgi:NADH-quinone oxidoreductase subunit A
LPIISLRCVWGAYIHISCIVYITIFFVIFDLETIFIVAWAVAFEEVGWAGYVGVAIFIGILLVALVYELKSGALDWGRKSRHSEPSKYAVLENG